MQKQKWSRNLNTCRKPDDWFIDGPIAVWPHSLALGVRVPFPPPRFKHYDDVLYPPSSYSVSASWSCAVSDDISNILYHERCVESDSKESTLFFRFLVLRTVDQLVWPSTISLQNENGTPSAARVVIPWRQVGTALSLVG